MTKTQLIERLNAIVLTHDRHEGGDAERVLDEIATLLAEPATKLNHPHAVVCGQCGNASNYCSQCGAELMHTRAGGTSGE